MKNLISRKSLQKMVLLLLLVLYHNVEKYYKSRLRHLWKNDIFSVKSTFLLKEFISRNFFAWSRKKCRCKSKCLFDLNSDDLIWNSNRQKKNKLFSDHHDISNYLMSLLRTYLLHSTMISNYDLLDAWPFEKYSILAKGTFYSFYQDAKKYVGSFFIIGGLVFISYK